MTGKEAYEIIIKATAVVQLDRANHQVLEQALAVIKAAITPKPE